MASDTRGNEKIKNYKQGLAAGAGGGVKGEGKSKKREGVREKMGT